MGPRCRLSFFGVRYILAIDSVLTFNTEGTLKDVMPPADLPADSPRALRGVAFIKAPQNFCLI